MALPGNVGFGTVRAKIIDSEGTPIQGTVTLKPSPRRLSDITATPQPVLILPKKVDIELDANGELLRQVVATNDSDMNPVGWTYNVSANLINASFDPFDIEVPEGTVVDLAVVAPISASNGTPIIRGWGVAPGGTDGQVLIKLGADDGVTQWLDITDVVRKGAADGVAPLDSALHVPYANLPVALQPENIDLEISQVTANVVTAMDIPGQINTAVTTLGNNLNADNLTTGTVPDARLPDRLGEAGTGAQSITDWNTAVTPGFYSSATSSTANAPGTSAPWQGFVTARGSNMVTQIAWQSATNTPTMYQRTMNNGVWGAWVRIYLTQTEQDARYRTSPVLGTADTEVVQLRGVEIGTDNRSITLAYTSGNLSTITEKSGATTVKTTTLGYVNGNVSTVTEVGGDKTMVTTLNYDGTGTLTGITKAG